MYEALESADIVSDFVVLEGAGHGLFTGADGITAANALKGWFDQHL
jgi:dipeptidyl aminopeptidase/acylaminoacyl peptidase